MILVQGIEKAIETAESSNRRFWNNNEPRLVKKITGILTISKRVSRDREEFVGTTQEDRLYLCIISQKDVR
jgi:hypothetical protein